MDRPAPQRSLRQARRLQFRLMLLLAGLGLAAMQLAAQPAPSEMQEVGNANLPSQRLGADDLIAVSVYDAPELTRTIRVEPTGEIHLPLLEGGIPASGLYARELESTIAGALKTGEILVEPIVKVTVVEYASRPVAVIGAVKKPVNFQVEGTVTLLDALARAEGLTEDAGPEILVTRKIATSTSGVGIGSSPPPLDLTEEPGRETRIISVKQLLEQGDSSLNIPLTGGEEIIVPKAKQIFVVGNVKKPGAFPVRGETDYTVLQLVALSEGLAPFAENIAYIVRGSGSPNAQQIPVELKKIMKRESPDLQLQPEDILYIPDNSARRTTMTVLDRIANFGVSTASGVLIWRR